MKAGEVQEELDKDGLYCMNILQQYIAAGPILPPMYKYQVLIYLNAVVYIKSTTLALTMQFLKHMTAVSYN